MTSRDPSVFFDPRADAAVALASVMSGSTTSTAALNRLLDAYRLRNQGHAADASLLHELVMGVLRRRLILEKIIGPCLHRPLKQAAPRVRELLLVMAFQAVFLDRIPEHAWVSASVDAARRIGNSRTAGFVNAVGRCLARLASPGKPASGFGPEIAYSVPPLVLKCMQGILGRRPLETELQAMIHRAPTTFRVPGSAATRRKVLETFASHGATARPTRFAGSGVVVEDWGGFDRRGIPGATMCPQDEASQLVVEVLAPVPGERVVDLCAGSGVKAAQVAQSAGEVVCVDTKPGKLRQALALFRTLGLPRPVVLAADGRHPPLSRQGWADAVLLDAPCTGLGTLVRRPEVRYVRKPGDVRRASHVQRRLLHAALDLAGPGARVLYAVCSFCPEEGPEVVRAVLDDRKDAGLAPIELDLPFVRGDGTFLTLPWRDGMDGFFMALVRKSGTPGR